MCVCWSLSKCCWHWLAQSVCCPLIQTNTESNLVLKLDLNPVYLSLLFCLFLGFLLLVLAARQVIISAGQSWTACGFPGRLTALLDFLLIPFSVRLFGRDTILKSIVFKKKKKSEISFLITSSETGKERSRNISVTTETCVYKVGGCWYQLESEQLLICRSRHGFVPFDTADTWRCWSFPHQKPGRQSF